MKNSNCKQHIKFKKQINHMSSFIGMPMWNGRNPSLSEIREFDRRLLEKQALSFEPKRKTLFRHQFDSLKLVLLKAFWQISKAETKKMKLGGSMQINKPIKTANECCG